jgi:hypothetical protein
MKPKRKKNRKERSKQKENKKIDKQNCEFLVLPTLMKIECFDICDVMRPHHEIFCGNRRDVLESREAVHLLEWGGGGDPASPLLFFSLYHIGGNQEQPMHRNHIFISKW